MADSKLSALTSAGAFADADLLYIVQGGTSYKTTWGAVKAAILLAKYPEVANFAALPAAADHNTETYVCLASQGTYFINRKPAGFYYSNGSAWSHVGDLPEDYFTDSILQISDDSDPTKICKFQLSSITAGNTRTLTVPDASGTIMLVGNAPTTHAASHTNGTDDIQSATASQKGLATATQITKLDGIEALADVTDAANVASAGALMTSALGTGVATALAINTGSAGAPVLLNGALGTPAGGTLTNCSFPTLNQNTTGTAGGLTALTGVKKTIGITIDGAGTAITTGVKGYVRVPWGCTATKWTLLADQTGSIVIDVWKDTYANFPPTDADAMPGSGKEPTITTATKAEDATITDWTTDDITAGDCIGFNVDSCTSITRATLEIEVTLT